MEWFSNLDTFLKVYWIIAGTASLIFIIQMIMTFVGMDSGDGFDADAGGDTQFEGPFQMFSIRNLINFFLGFGWGGVCFSETFSFNSSNSTKILISICAFLTGILFVAIFFFIIKQFLKLSKDNSFRIENTVGNVADVYLVIPAEKSGKGKIQISVKGAFHEIDAITEGEKIPTGGKAKVISVIDSQTVLVNKL